jgi:RNA methyltransferase, TrmH family
VPISLGAHSPKVAAVRALLTPRGRRERGLFAFEGPTLLAEALAAGVQPEEVYATQPAWDALGPIADQLAGTSYIVAERTLARLSDVETPTGIVAVARRRIETAGALLADPEPVLLLTGVADPGNAGSLLRSAEIFGIDRVLFGADGVEPHNPKVVRASMGAIFRLRIAVADQATFAAAVLASGHVVVAAAKGGAPVAEFPFIERSVLAVGSERHGTARWLAAPDATVGIPHYGAGESLNAAAAGAIILYEFARRTGHSAAVSRPKKP